LAKTYAIADVAFVGRSLNAPGGGHNLLEPVAQGVPVLHGPYVENFQKVASELKAQGLAFTVSDDQTLFSTVRRLLLHADELPMLRKKATAYVQSKRVLPRNRQIHCGNFEVVPPENPGETPMQL
jgi:3-deoxy-D-manno-octulosonic-acid transferase